MRWIHIKEQALVTFEKWEIVQSNLEFTEIPLHQIQDYNSEKLHFEQEIKKLM